MGSREQSLPLRVRALLGERRRNDSRAALPVRPKPYVTLRVGGPLDGTLTLTSTGSAGVTVEAIWGRGRRHRTSLTRPSERAALLLANTWAEELIDGRKPTDSLDRRI